MAPCCNVPPRSELLRLRQRRWRQQQKRDLMQVAGDVPRRLVEDLVDLQRLAPAESGDRRAIMRAMVAALHTVRSK
jgi:hypothetical protein